MVRIPMAMSEHEVCNPYNLENIALLTTMCLRRWARDLKFIIKSEGFLKVTDSHVHWKSGNISETVPDRDVVTRGH